MLERFESGRAFNDESRISADVGLDVAGALEGGTPPASITTLIPRLDDERDGAPFSRSIKPCVPSFSFVSVPTSPSVMRDKLSQFGC
jgi:hypothetical protein